MTAPAAPREPWITEPGVFDDITEAEYHRDPVVGGSLSSTGARKLLPPSCPARFAYDRDHPKTSKVLDIGKAAHRAVLGTGAVIREVDVDDRRSKVWKDAEKAAAQAGETAVTRPEGEHIRGMVDALRAHPVAGPLFARPGAREQVLVWHDPDTGVWCRVMADLQPHVELGARPLIVDYKTTRSAEPSAFAGSVGSYGYHQQAAWYCEGVAATSDADEPPLFVLVAQEKEPPYLVTVSYLDDQALDIGRRRNDLARGVYARCARTGQWPGYGDDIHALSLPGWLVRAHEDDEYRRDLIGDDE